MLAFQQRDNKPLLETHSGGLVNTATFTTVIQLNFWCHIAVSVNAGACRFYVDGDQAGSGSG